MNHRFVALTLFNLCFICSAVLGGYFVVSKWYMPYQERITNTTCVIASCTDLDYKYRDATRYLVALRYTCPLLNLSAGSLIHEKEAFCIDHPLNSTIVAYYDSEEIRQTLDINYNGLHTESVIFLVLWIFFASWIGFILLVLWGKYLILSCRLKSGQV